MIPEAAVEAAAATIDTCGCESPEWVARDALEAAYPILAAQVLRDAVVAFPLETITAPDNAVVWLRRRAEQIARGNIAADEWDGLVAADAVIRRNMGDHA